MKYEPLNYRELNITDNMFMPNTVKSYNNKTFMYWCRALYQRACSVLEFTVPEEWQGAPIDLLYWCLFRYGYVLVWKDVKYGYVFNPCSLSGKNIYYQFTTARVSNPALNEDITLEFTLGKDADLLKMSPDYFGFWDIICFYAEKLSTIDVAMNTSLINSKYGLILGAKNRGAVEALKKAMDKINRGEPAVIVDKTIADDTQSKDTPFQIYEQNIKAKYITTDLLADAATILKNFDAEVGIPSLDDKKERLVTSEAEAKQTDSKARSLVWFDTLVNSIDKIKELYPDINLDVRLRYETTTGGDELVVRENDTDRPD